MAKETEVKLYQQLLLSGGEEEISVVHFPASCSTYYYVVLVH